MNTYTLFDIIQLWNYFPISFGLVAYLNGKIILVQGGKFVKNVIKKALCVLLAFMMVLPSMAIIDGLSNNDTVVAYAASKKSKSKTSVAKPKILSVKAKASNSLDVSFKAVSKVNGYEISYSTNKKFKKKTTKKVVVKITKKNKKSKKFTKRISKLKKNKKYYVRVRAYKVVKKKKVYGKYSSVKAAKAKKISKPAVVQPVTEPTVTQPVTEPTVTQPELPEKLPVNPLVNTSSNSQVVTGEIPANPATAQVVYNVDEATRFTKGEWTKLLIEKIGADITEYQQVFGYSYSDINGNENAAYIEAAHSLGILPESADPGYDANNDVPVFYPQELATREFAAYTAVKAAGFVASDSDIINFADAASIKNIKEVSVAVKNEFLNASGGSFNPNAEMTGTDKNQIFAKLDNLKASLNIDKEKLYQNITYSPNAEGANSSDYTVTTNADQSFTVAIPETAGNFKVGDVVILPANNTYITGFPIKVTAVSSSNGNYTITAVTPDIAEVYTGIEYQGYGTPDVSKIQPAEGVSVAYDPNGLVNSGGAQQFKIDTGDQSVSGFGKISLNLEKKLSDNSKLTGSIEVSVPEIRARLKASVGLFSGIKIEDFLVSATEKLKVTGSLSVSSPDSNVTKDWILTKVPVPIGPTGLSVDFVIYATVSAEGEVSISYSIDSTQGLQIVNGTPRYITSITHNLDNISLKGEFKIGPKISLGLWALSVFNIVGIAADLGLGANASLNVHPDVTPTLTCIAANLFVYFSVGLDDECLASKITEWFSIKASIDILDDESGAFAKLHFENGVKVDECTYGSGYFSGRIVERRGNAVIGIPGASVNIYSGNSFVGVIYSDSDGKFKTENLPIGEYRVVVSATGYKRYVSTETISVAGGVSIQPYEMTPKNSDGTGFVQVVVNNAVNGEAIGNVAYKVYQGWNNINGDVIANGEASNGTFDIELPVGNFTIYAEAEGFSASIVNVAVIEDETINKTITLNPYDSSLEGKIRVVLNWGEEPSDLDSHMYYGKANLDGFEHHMYFAVRNDEEYNSEVCDLDTDDVDSYGPETITVFEVDQNSKYSYFVHNYTDKSYTNTKRLSESGATIRVFFGNELRATFFVPADTEGTVWHVFDYDPSTDAIIPVNEMYYQNYVEDVNIRESDFSEYSDFSESNSDYYE